MADSVHAEQLTCFVAMPVTTPGNYGEKLRDYSHFLHVLDHLFRPALTEAGYRVIAPTVRGAELIHAEIIKNLEQADLVLCDLSSFNANVFFELGIRTSLDRPVALVKDKMTDGIPFDLSAINIHTYDESLAPWMLADEIKQLAEHVKAVDTGSDKGNDMWHYFGLTKRAAPAQIAGNPVEAKLDLLLDEIMALREQRTASFMPEVAEHLSLTSGDVSAETVGTWFRHALRSYEKGTLLFNVVETENGYRIDVNGPLARYEKSLLQQDALRRLGNAGHRPSHCVTRSSSPRAATKRGTRAYRLPAGASGRAAG